MSTRHNDMRRIVTGLTRIENSSPEYDGSKKDAAVTLIRRTLKFATAALNANASNLVAPNATTSQERAIANGRVLGAIFLPTANVTAAGGDNGTVALAKLHANGVTATPALASATSNTSANGGTGNLVIGVGATLTVADGANARFTKGQILAPELTQNASGVALPTGTLVVDVELEGPADDYPY